MDRETLYDLVEEKIHDQDSWCDVQELKGV